MSIRIILWTVGSYVGLLTLPGLNLFRLHFSWTYCSLPTTPFRDKLWRHKNSKYGTCQVSSNETGNKFVILQQYNLRILYAKHMDFTTPYFFNARNEKKKNHNYERVPTQHYSHVDRLSLGNNELNSYAQITKVGFPLPSVRRNGVQPGSSIPETGTVITHFNSGQLLEASETNTLAEFGQLCKKPTPC